MQKNITAILVFSIFIIFSSGLFAEENTAGAGPISVERLAICRDVVDREPVEAGDVFEGDVGVLFCFTQLIGAKEPTKIYHNWFYKGDQIASVKLNVKSANWRTYSTKKISPSFRGEWKVEIVNAEGELLKKMFFLIN